jgi:8-oxo-dGTP pyrophosphatase MutT (NUDIX family)
VAIFVARHGRTEALVVHRSPAGGAYWHTIAGGVEPGEEPGTAARRELLEETGLDTEPKATGIVFVYPLHEESDERRALYEPGLTEIRVECFLAEAPDGWEPSLDHEHDGYRWLPAAEAPGALFWPDIAEAMQQALAAP